MGLHKQSRCDQLELSCSFLVAHVFHVVPHHVTIPPLVRIYWPLIQLVLLYLKCECMSSFVTIQNKALILCRSADLSSINKTPTIIKRSIFFIQLHLQTLLNSHDKAMSCRDLATSGENKNI